MVNTGITIKGDIIYFLRSQLPLSINAIDSLIRFPERTKLITEYENNSLASLGIVFESSYNSHVWFSPFAWIFGAPDSNLKILKHLLKFYSSGIVCMGYESDLLSNENFVPEIKRYQEDLMILSESKTNFKTNEEEIIRLSHSDAVASVLISRPETDNETLKFMSSRESRFISERLVFGVYSGSILASRGAIMSIYDHFSAIGGFVTDRRMRRRGFGTKTVSFISGHLHALGIEPFLTVRSDNQPAINLYRSLGFSKLREVVYLDFLSGTIP